MEEAAFKHEHMTREEKDSIIAAIRAVEEAVKARCVANGANESEINSSLYEIQDFTDAIEVSRDEPYTRMDYPAW